MNFSLGVESEKAVPSELLLSTTPDIMCKLIFSIPHCKVFYDKTLTESVYINQQIVTVLLLFLKE